MKRIILFLLLIACVCLAQTGLRSPGFVGGLTVPKATTGSPSTLLTGLVAYWDMSGANNADETDQTGNGHTLIAVGATKPQSTTGINGSCRTNDGVGYFYVSSNSISASDFLSDKFSVSFWINPASIATAKGASGIWIAASGRRRFYVNMQPTVFNAIWSTNGSAAGTMSSSSSYSVGTWYHIMVVAGENSIKWYLNNTQIDADTPSSYLQVTALADFEVLRASGTTTTAGIDEYGFWNRELTEAERGTLYGSGNPPPYPFTGLP